MADQTTASERGAGGKLRRPPPRKPPPSPYARPPEATRRSLISKLVDPAYRLIAGGATRFLPSFFSAVAAPPPPPSLPCPTSAAEDQDKWKTADSHKDDSRRSDIHLLVSKSSEMASIDDISKLKSSSDVLSRQDEKLEKSDKNGISDIEQLVKRSKFSRDEFDRLLAVLNSRVMDLSNVEGKENTNLFSRKDDEGHAMAHRLPKVINEQRLEESTGAKWGTSTPLDLSKVRDEIGASPIEIARAYMDSRALEAGPSSGNMIHNVESTVHGDEAAIIPYDPSPSKKSSTCWPGAVVQDAYITPQSQRNRYGLHNFPRTPYSRTLLTKPKSKLINMKGDSSDISSTPVVQSKTTIYLQDKSKAGASESGYGSVGPIRRTRHNVGAQLSSRRPAYSSLSGSSQRESSGVIEGFTHVAKSTEPVGTSSTRKPLGLEMGVPTVPMHTSLMAKKILDHIDRNIPTPKEKSAELKLAIKWKNPESSIDFSTILSNEDNGSLKLNDVSCHKFDGLEGKESTLWNQGRENYHMQPKESTDKFVDGRKEGTLASNVNAYSSIPRLGNDGSTVKKFGGSQIFSMKSSKEDAMKTTLLSGGHPFGVNQEQKPLTNPATIKPALPPISIKKPESRWTLPSDNGSGSGFTFPVSASSSVFSEPPTPSITPLLSAGDQPQLKEGSTELSYSFGLKNSSPAVVFSFPSTSNTAIQNEAGDIKFNFGSTEKPRLSFSFGKNAVCC